MVFFHNLGFRVSLGKQVRPDPIIGDYRTDFRPYKSESRLSDPIIPKAKLKVDYRQNPKPVVDCRFVD